jgi:hypothetical protein
VCGNTHTRLVTPPRNGRASSAQIISEERITTLRGCVLAGPRHAGTHRITPIHARGADGWMVEGAVGVPRQIDKLPGGKDFTLAVAPALPYGTSNTPTSLIQGTAAVSDLS